jgi:hypothetical protein
LILAACDFALERKYYQEGIGTDLVTQSVISTADLQDVYIYELCRQAGGIQVATAGSEPIGGCPWGLVTLAGLNDIDQRCDAYLAWLDDKRRSKEPILSEIAAISAATTAILNATGVGVTPITLVGIAFGLTSNTFTNVRSRLLLEINHSTVQAIVLRRQKEYRDGLRNQVIDTRAAAIYAMRSYLRLCMPMTIETEINTTVTAFEQGGSAALKFKENNRAIDPRTVGAVATPQRIRVSEAPPPTPPPSQVIGGSNGPVEKTISLNSGKAFQRTLCVDDTGNFDSATRAALRDFNAASLFPTDSAANNTVATDADLNRLRVAQRRFPSCRDAGFLNGYEVGLFTRFTDTEIRGNLVRALNLAGLPVPVGLAATGGKPMDDAVRQAVANLRMKYSLPGQPVFDRIFYRKVIDNIER